MKGGDRHRARDERGAVALLSGLVALTLLVVAALVVDIGGTWLRRGQLQVQADKAALFAAESLPATDSASKLAVAKRVAYYLACHQVAGQAQLNVAIPACPSSTSSPTLDIYAQLLLNEGLVTFPSSTQVHVVTPASQVDFAFAGAVGVENSVQQKVATAKVSSPGTILPVGLSLQCLASIVNNAGLGNAINGILPLSYITPGNFSSTGTLDPDQEPTFEPWGADYSGTNASASVTVASPVVNGSSLTLTVSSPGLLPTLNGLLGGNEVVFKRGDVTVGPFPAASLDLIAGAMVVNIPQEVQDTPGIWHVKVKLFTSSFLNLGLIGLNPKWSQLDVTFPIYPSQTSVVDRLVSTLSGMLNLKDFLACGRLLDSPRPVDGGTPALTRNLQEGLDHALTRNQALVQALATQNLAGLNGTAGGLANVLSTTVNNVLSNPTYALLGCAGTTYNRLDTTATWTATQQSGAAPANCARIGAAASTEQEFTDGLLKDTPSTPSEPGYGRLSCSRDGACEGATTTLPGFNGTYNNDSFSDFVKGGQNTVLDGNLAFALDTYLLPNLPLITPNDSIENEIYTSPRFGWAPVLSYVDLNSAGTADYPILTFRPVFLDNGSAEDLKILGLNVGNVVDGLAQHLQGVVQAAIDAVRTSLGILGTVLDTVLTVLGVNSILNNLGVGSLNDALSALSSGLGLDMGTEKAGLVIQDGKLKAARFMTVAPGALPVVPKDYKGPMTDYVGVGPKIVRLVE